MRCPDMHLQRRRGVQRHVHEQMLGGAEFLHAENEWRRCDVHLLQKGVDDGAAKGPQGSGRRGWTEEIELERALVKTKRPPFPAAACISIIVLRIVSSLAGLAATYSSKS